MSGTTLFMLAHEYMMKFENVKKKIFSNLNEEIQTLDQACPL